VVVFLVTVLEELKYFLLIVAVSLPKINAVDYILHTKKYVRRSPNTININVLQNAINGILVNIKNIYPPL
jgi:hypothetical protein